MSFEITLDIPYERDFPRDGVGTATQRNLPLIVGYLANEPANCWIEPLLDDLLDAVSRWAQPSDVQCTALANYLDAWRRRQNMGTPRAALAACYLRAEEVHQTLVLLEEATEKWWEEALLAL